MTKLLPTLATAIAVPLGYFALLFLAQRKLLFPTPPAPLIPRPPSSTEVIHLPLPAGPVEAWYMPPTTATGHPVPLLLFTHGNAELIDDWADAFDEPRRWGIGVLLLEYPGYGRSAGRPSEATIFAAMTAARRWAAGDPRIDATRLVAYGRSLGAGPAARLAADGGTAALVLESAFTSVRAFARRFLAPGWLVRDPFDNTAALATYRGPLLVLHGDRDEIIPTAHGQELAALVPGSEFHALPCGHNDCPRAWGLVRSFLARHDLLPGA